MPLSISQSEPRPGAVSHGQRNTAQGFLDVSGTWCSSPYNIEGNTVGFGTSDSFGQGRGIERGAVREIDAVTAQDPHGLGWEPAWMTRDLCFQGVNVFLVLSLDVTRVGSCTNQVFLAMMKAELPYIAQSCTNFTSNTEGPSHISAA
jgi:hypothetical protein